MIYVNEETSLEDIFTNWTGRLIKAWGVNTYNHNRADPVLRPLIRTSYTTLGNAIDLICQYENHFIQHNRIDGVDFEFGRGSVELILSRNGGGTLTFYFIGIDTFAKLRVNCLSVLESFKERGFIFKVDEFGNYNVERKLLNKEYIDWSDWYYLK